MNDNSIEEDLIVAKVKLYNIVRKEYCRLYIKI